jgi:hypothetical protein
VRILPCITLTLLVAALIARADPATTPAAPFGLSVSGGVLTKDARPYHAIGVNYFSLFSRVLANPADTTSLDNLTRLSRARIPFVRFMCGGFWPIEQKLYIQDRDDYFRRLDRVVRAAEKARTGLIPSLFWNYSTASDLVGEPLDQLGNPDSRMIAFIRQYTKDIVTRYRDSPAIWGWEFGNEYTLSCDLPNAAEHRPPIWPELGTATTRTARDDLRFALVAVAYAEFARTVRTLDPSRIIISGNGAPRRSAHHNFADHSWTLDTPQQFAQVLLRDNPDPMDVICIHAYPDAKNEYPGPADTIDAMFAAASAVAAQAGKPLFVGEFGAPASLGPRKERAAFDELLAALVKHRVPLSALWVFDNAAQDDEWNVTFDDRRAYMLQRVIETQEKLK